jgi:hypothetical protein
MLASRKHKRQEAAGTARYQAYIAEESFYNRRFFLRLQKKTPGRASRAAENPELKGVERELLDAKLALGAWLRHPVSHRPEARTHHAQAFSLTIRC